MGIFDSQDGNKDQVVIPPKRYYENHNGTRPMTPDVERYVRQTIKNYGWTQEPTFHGYVEEYLW